MKKKTEKFELHLIVEEDEKTAVELLSSATGFPKQKIKQVMQNGAVWLGHNKNTRRLRRAKRKLMAGDELHLYYDEAVQSAVPQPPELIADEGDYSVFFKPRGMFSQGSKWGDQCTINRWVELNMDRPAFIVHRLDRATSGLILIAHTKTAAAALSQLFERRLIKKRYRARVVGRFEPSTAVLAGDIDGRKALSRVHLLEYDEADNCSLLDVAIETGRKHQIRRHLAEAGYPVIGDRLYGQGEKRGSEGDQGQEGPDLQLVATELSFCDPFNRGPEKEDPSDVWKNSRNKTSVMTKSYLVPDHLLIPELLEPVTKKSLNSI